MGKTPLKKSVKASTKAKPDAASKPAKPWVGVYMKFPNDAFAALQKLEAETGKNRTVIFADYVLGRRQFSTDVDAWIHRVAKERGISFQEAASQLFSEAVQFGDQLTRNPGKP